MIAQAVVHTTGINIESVAVIVGAVVGLLTLVLAWTSRKQSQLQLEIAAAVNHQTELLMLKLETKDNVNDLRIDMVRQLAVLTTKVESIKEK